MDSPGVISNTGQATLESRILADDCIRTKRLQTPFEADTVVYGTMFTVQTSTDSITMLSMEISANPIGTEMDVEIYTKLGNYIGAESDPSQWEKIVDTSLTPAREGRGTTIPEDQFKKFTMEKNELRAFFVSLKTSDLRYKSGTDDIEAGQPFVSDGYVSVNSGIGIAEYGFSNQIFPSRLFSGIFYYSHVADCSAPSSKVLVTYSFHAQPKGGAILTRAEVINALNSLVDDAVNDLLNSELSSSRDEYMIAVASVSSTTSLLEQADCPVLGWPNCVLINCEVTLTHSYSISGGSVTYLLLGFSDKVTTLVHQGNLDVEYAGFATIKTSLLVALQGVPVGMALDKEQKSFVEEVATEYAAEKTMGVVDATIVGTTITNQRGPGISQRNLRNLQNSSSADGWIELTVDVLAIHPPPYTGAAEFGDIILSSFRSRQNDFVDDLKAARYRPDSQVQGESGEFFAGITNVNVRSVDDVTNVGVGETEGGSTGEIMGLSIAAFSAICVSVFLVAGAWIWFINRRTKKASADDVIVEYVDSTGRRRRRSSVAFMFGGNIPAPTTGDKKVKIGEAFAIEGTRQQSTTTVELEGSSCRSRNIVGEGESICKSDVRQELSRKRSMRPRSHSRDSSTSSREFNGTALPHNNAELANENFGKTLTPSSASRARNEDGTTLSRHDSHDPSVSNSSSHARARHTNKPYPQGETDRLGRANALSAAAHTRNEEGMGIPRQNSRDPSKLSDSYHARDRAAMSASAHARHQESMGIPRQNSRDPSKPYASNSAPYRAANSPYSDGTTGAIVRGDVALASASTHARKREQITVSRKNSQNPPVSNSSGHVRSLANNGTYSHGMNVHNVRTDLSSSSHNEQSKTVPRQNSREPSMPNSSSHVRAVPVNTSYPHDMIDHNLRFKSSHNPPISLGESHHSTRATRTIDKGLGPIGSSHDQQPSPFINRDSYHSTRATRTIGTPSIAHGLSHDGPPVTFANSDFRHTTRAARTVGTGLDIHRNDDERVAAVRLSIQEEEVRRMRESSTSHNRQPASSVIGDARHSVRATRTRVGGGLAQTSESSSHARARAPASSRMARTTGLSLTNSNDGAAPPEPRIVPLSRGGVRSGDDRVQSSQSMRATRTTSAMHDARLHVDASLRATRTPLRTSSLSPQKP